MVTLFAKTNFRDKEEVFGIKEDDRRRHMYLLGKTGMGKTNLLETMVIQDIRAGKGVAYIDPHGDTAEELISFIPKERLNDIVYFNPSDMEYPVAFNVLETVDDEHKHLVASGMMGVFKKIWPDVWSPRMEHILNYTILALLDYPGSTMLGINRMLADKQFRNKVLNKVKDPIVKSFWVNEFAKWNERYVGEAIAPIQNKVGQFVATPLIRNIISQAKSTLRMREIMDEGKILIVNLSKGKIGEEAMQLLGGMVVTKLQLAAMERVDIPEQDRKDFYLYVDEFQNFATESFANILSEARKYRLNLIMAHQYISQLVNDGNTYMRDAIFGNVGTMISFRIGAEDAELVAKEFEPVVFPYDLVNLPKYHVYLKLMIDGVAGDAFSASTLAPVSPGEDAEPDKIIRVSRERYGQSRKKVEEKIARWSGNLIVDAQQNKGNQKNKPTHERIDGGRIQNEKQAESTSATSTDGKNSQTKEMFKATCDECGKQIEVPFKPDGVRGTYCQDCLKKIRRQRAKLTDMDKPVSEKIAPMSLKETQKRKPVSIKKKVDLIGLNQLIKEAVKTDDKDSNNTKTAESSTPEKNSKERKED
ncbi:MAG: type IV secretion system DNA-binding domain-containing protein [Patescibacteria group bacterium]|nr:type IV secretion system DNA-binding domain-containing protein [Patescibacteria group bacterium]